MKLENKVALVTGGSAGIGSAIAQRFVAEGAKICIAGRRKEHLEKVAAALPSDAVKIIAGDVSNPQDVEQMVEKTLTFGNKIDILVNNAGVNLGGKVTDISLDDWRKTFDTNLDAPFLLMRKTIPHMIENGGGSIINISSIGGTRCLPERVGYCTSKAALIMLTQQAALDYGPQNIRCNVVCPGFVYTSMTEGHFGEFGEISQHAFRNVPLRRGASPEEISGICTYLASDDSSFMTGSILKIDGGTSIVDVFGASVRD